MTFPTVRKAPPKPTDKPKEKTYATDAMAKALKKKRPAPKPMANVDEE